MPLQKIRLTEALKKLHLKTVSMTPAPLSPRSILGFQEDESDEDPIVGSSHSSSVPPDVQKGFFAVYVGEESKRYVIPLSYLKHRVFVALLRGSEEEFGFCHTGAIRLPCETVLFDHLLWLLNKDDPSIQSLEMEELLDFYQ